MSSSLLALQNVSKFYTSGQSVVVGIHDVTLSFSAGEFVAVTGESGSGKSTLAGVLGGTLPYESGELLVGNLPTSHYDSADWEMYRRDRIAYISQSYGILPGLTVQKNVAGALRLVGLPRREASIKAQEILKEVGLFELRHRRAAKLSSGQKQRLSIARALAKPVPILIADEPTGNLDSESSAKVIELLAAAARDRLVILITHEFQEVDGYATRRIHMQDGRVSMDAKLAPTKEAPAANALPGSRSVSPAEKKRAARLGGYIARAQFFSRPVWCVIMTLLFALAAFSTFIFAGTFVRALDETASKIYDQSAFRNGDPRRVVVMRRDGKSMDEKDFTRLLSVADVTELEPYGFIADVNYYYLEGTDYTVTRERRGDAMTGYYYSDPVYSFSDVERFMKTVPLLPAGESFLTAGRLPERADEAVLAGDPSLIGTEFEVFFQAKKIWPVDARAGMKITVVGTTDRGVGLYFHGDLGRSFNTAYKTSNFFYLPDVSLPEGQARVSDISYTESLANYKRLVDALTRRGEYDRIPPFPTKDIWSEATGEQYPVDVIGNHSFRVRTLIFLSQADFDRMLPPDYGIETSLTVSDYAYAGRVIRALNKLDYEAASPYQIGSVAPDFELLAERLQTLAISLGVFLAVAVLLIIAASILFRVQHENYRQLANIGLTFRVARRSVFWQLLLFALLGLLLAAVPVLLMAGAEDTEALPALLSLLLTNSRELFRYLEPLHYLILAGLYLLICILAAFVASKGLRRRVFPFVRKREDLDWDEYDRKEAAV